MLAWVFLFVDFVEWETQLFEPAMGHQGRRLLSNRLYVCVSTPHVTRRAATVGYVAAVFGGNWETLTHRLPGCYCVLPLAHALRPLIV